MKLRHIDPGQVLLEPMEPAEQELLMHIFKKRRKLFFQVFATLNLMAILSAINGASRMHHVRSRGMQVNNGDWKLPFETEALIGFALLTLMIYGSGLYIYRKRIGSLRRDARSGQKCVVWLPVLRKQYFPQTGQFFISLNNPQYMHHEVDQAVYERFMPGDLFPVYFGRCSGYAFNKNGAFSLM